MTRDDRGASAIRAKQFPCGGSRTTSGIRPPIPEAGFPHRAHDAQLLPEMTRYIAREERYRFTAAKVVVEQPEDAYDRQTQVSEHGHSAQRQA